MVPRSCVINKPVDLQLDGAEGKHSAFSVVGSMLNAKKREHGTRAPVDQTQLSDVGTAIATYWIGKSN